MNQKTPEQTSLKIEAKCINADSALYSACTKCLPTITATCDIDEELLSDELGHLGLDIANVTQAPKH